MSDGILKGWSEYKPTKTVWLWSCVGAAVLTMIVGFTWAGWVTGGTANKRVETSTEQAVAQFAAGICVDKFLSAADAKTKLAALKDTDSWKQDAFIEKGGWVTFAGIEEPVDGAAALCANQLSATTLPVVDAGA